MSTPKRTKSNLLLDLTELTSDEEDDELLNDTTSVFKKTPRAASLRTPKQEEYLTPLGTSTFPIVFGEHASIGQEVTLELEEKGFASHVRINDSQGQRMSPILKPETEDKLVAILRHPKLHCRTTRTTADQIHIVFSGKADRILGEFECAPLLRELQKHCGFQNFTRIRKVSPLKTESINIPTPIMSALSVAGVPSSAASAAAAANTSNIHVNHDGFPYTAEQEALVKRILEGENKGHYAILHIPEAATISAIKQSYRNIAKLVHPGKNQAPGALRAFQLVGRAYLVLSDPEQRVEYDTELRQMAHQKPAASTDSSTSVSSVDFDAYEQYCLFFDEDDVEGVQVDMEEPDWENQKGSLETMFDEHLASQTTELPEYPMPPQFAHINLFDYQIDGIRWLIHNEKRTSSPSWFTEEGPRLWRDKITGSTFSRRPPPVKGGILADDMGLGKTLQAIGLILSNPPEGQMGYPYVASRSRGNSKSCCTLILCPLSVIANWTMQIRRHVNRTGRQNILRVGVYHGPSRKQMVKSIQENYYDVVLTSYQTLAYDYRRYIGADKDAVKIKPSKKVMKSKEVMNEIFLFDILLHRVICDESHIIRNSKATLFKAAKMLSATNRLCLTGTPFVNRPDDIHSLLSFLGALPLAQKSVFRAYVTDKIRERREVGMSVLRTAMAYITLRRKKDAVANSVQLVERTVHVTPVAFSDGQHKIVHDALYDSARAILIRMLSFGEDVVLDNYMDFLALILRVRQAACHTSLIPPGCAERATKVLDIIRQKAVREEIDVEEVEELLDRLRGAFEGDEKVEECAVCFESIGQDSAMVLRTCKHIFCGPCLNRVQNSCPMCRARYTFHDVVSKASLERVAGLPVEKKHEQKNKRDANELSPKIHKLFSLIDEMKPDEKGVIFSQWTSLLNIVQLEMQKLGHTFTRIDGSMSPQERINAMEKFDTEKCDSQRTPRFILCSLHACGMGINLERANVAFMLDPWWNLAAENQAMNRIHRISRTKAVRVYRLVMENALEHRMLGLQDAKELLGKSTHERLTQEEKRKARLTQLRDLFEVPENLEQDWIEY